MEVFAGFLANIETREHRERTKNVLDWINTQFPHLVAEIKWNQPMFTHRGTFIIAFSIAKKHLAVAPEQVAIDQFSADIKEAGYEHTKHLIRIPWNKEVDFSLLQKLIAFNIIDKADCSTFWRK